MRVLYGSRNFLRPARVLSCSDPPRNLNRRFVTRCAKAGVRRITVHEMRHACATLLAALDMHPWVAMRILGHAQIDVTMNVYTEVSDARTLQALKRLGR